MLSHSSQTQIQPYNTPTVVNFKCNVKIQLSIANTNTGKNTVVNCKWKYSSQLQMEIQLPLANRNTNIGHWLKPPPSPQLNLIKGLRVQVSDLQAARHIYLEIFFIHSLNSFTKTTNFISFYGFS